VLGLSAGAAEASADGGAHVSHLAYVSHSAKKSGADTSCKTAKYRDVNTAIAAVSVGGTVIVCAGTYDEQVVVSKSLNLYGRGGATIMAQMTVAAALAEESDDDWSRHLDDTLASGRGLCDEALAAILCEEALTRIREMGDWRVGWARRDTGRIAQVTAPGHSRPRCCYVDFLNTGPAVAATLRKRIGQIAAIRRVSNLQVTDIVTAGGEAIGAVALDIANGEAVTIAAGAVILAAGGLTGTHQGPDLLAPAQQLPDQRGADLAAATDNENQRRPPFATRLRIVPTCGHGGS